MTISRRAFLGTAAATAAAGYFGVPVRPAAAATAVTFAGSGIYNAPNWTHYDPEFSSTRLATTPKAKWYGSEWVADPYGEMQRDVATAAGKTLVAVIYAIPGRDSGNYSAGGLSSRQAYLDWVTRLRDGSGDAPVIWLVEPDALPLADGLPADKRTERIETLRQALLLLRARPNQRVFMDIGHSAWKSPADAASLLMQVGADRVFGFAINTSNYRALQECYSYGAAVTAALATTYGVTGKKFMVDTGRNGAGPITDADRPEASPWLDSGMAWCNPPGMKIGRPTGLPPAATNPPASCAFLCWVNGPGGSDGPFPNLSQSSHYGVDAPNAGNPFPPRAREMLGLPVTR